MTSDGALTYEWDGFNRLARAKEGAATVATYLYDAEGRRVGKDADSAATRYALDGWREIEEYAGATVWPRRQFVFGAFIDEPLAMDVNDSYGDTCTGTGDHRYYYLQNWIYSVVALTSASGRVVEGYQYDPYGHHLTFGDDGQSTDFAWLQTIADRGASMYGNPFLFTGRRFDAETGLFYYRNRYYDVPTGRFISRDPAGYGDGPNVYQYVWSNPIIHADPTGKYAEVTFYMKQQKIIAKDIDNKTGKIKGSIEVKNVWSGNVYANDPTKSYMIGRGPVPTGKYCLGYLRNVKNQSGHGDVHPDGDWDWFPVLRFEKYDPKTSYILPTTDPSGKTVSRTSIFLHTGRESNGCITVMSDTEPEVKDATGNAIPNPKYPRSKDYSKLKKFILRAGAYEDPATCIKCPSGIFYVKP